MSKLICTLVVLLVLSWDMTSSASLNEAELKQIETKCLKQQSLSNEERLSILEKWKFDADMSKIDKRFKCYMSCGMQEAGLMDSTGHVDIDKHVNQFHLERQMVSDCNDEQAKQTDVCDHAVGLFNCLWKKNPGMVDLKAGN